MKNCILGLLMAFVLGCTKNDVEDVVLVIRDIVEVETSKSTVRFSALNILAKIVEIIETIIEVSNVWLMGRFNN